MELSAAIPHGHDMRGRLDVSITDWITKNAKKTKVAVHNPKIPWNILFLTMVWQIWKDRNRKSFDNVDVATSLSSKLSLDYAAEIVEAFNTTLISGEQNPV